VGSAANDIGFERQSDGYGPEFPISINPSPETTMARIGRAGSSKPMELRKPRPRPRKRAIG
jgi:hypothetical protein